MNFSVIVNYNTTSLKPRATPEKVLQQQMNSRFDPLAKGLLSLAVILMFTIALIAGQARANLPAEASATSDFGLSTRMSVILDSESLSKIRSLPYAIDIILALPIDIELSIDELTLGRGNAEDAGPDDSAVQ